MLSMKNNDLNVMFSHKSDHWATPKDIYDKFMQLGYYDPCPLNSATNNLNTLYEHDKIYINPPYSDIDSWIDFGLKHFNHKTNVIVYLVPARTDTKWFHKALEKNAKVFFIKGRLHFNGGGSAPFPSIYLVFDKDNIGDSRLGIKRGDIYEKQ